MTLKKGSWLKATALVVVVAMFVGMGLLGGSGQNGLKSNHFKVEGVLSATGANTVASGTQIGNGFVYQGRLTDATGNPVTNGSYSMVFNLYDAATGGTPLQTKTYNVTVTNGLFSQVLEFGNGYFTGEARYLGIQVGTDTEMTPRQAIYAVPYAYSLKPGATVEGDVSWYNSILHTWIYPPVFVVENTATGGPAIYGGSTSTTGDTIGVKGESNSPNGYGGVFRNYASGGTGLRANGPTNGVAIEATGSGVIQSSAKSYVWVPGTSFLKMDGDLSKLLVDYSTSGGAFFWRTAQGYSYIIASVPVPAVLYGQNVKITKVTVYYKCSSASSFIDSTYVNCMDSSGNYYPIVVDSQDYKSTTFSSYEPSINSNFNTLNVDFGSVTVSFVLYFDNNTDSIKISGVRFELEHD